MPRRKWAIIEAPYGLGLTAPGVEDAPSALLEAGLAERIGARRAGSVTVPAHDAAIDPESGILNAQALASYSVALADVVGAVIEAGERPLVLGGDCSILLGNLLALRRRGRFGLLFLDGHADFYQPAADPSGEAASMELALATGRGPALLADLEGRSPLVREADVVALGRRDAEEAAHYGSQRIEDTAITVIDLPAIRRDGSPYAAERALAHLESQSVEGFWIHLDVDVLDDSLMPAVDYRLRGGLTWLELDAILGAALANGHAIGLGVAIYNPRLDEGGRVGAELTRHLGDALKG